MTSLTILKAVAVIVIVFIVAGIYYTRRSLPAGVSVTGERYRVPAESVTFLADRTYVDEQGQRHSDQQIFNEVFRMIEQAEAYILVDMFLYNSFQSDPPETTRALAEELTQALITKKQTNPNITITVVSDPLNTVYGGATSPEFEQLEQAGIEVVLTDLKKLRDSNPLYSVGWRTFLQWFGNSVGKGIAPHPFQADGQLVTARSWLSLLNFKANHRKLIVADQRQPNGSLKLATLVTSANPHNGSSAHSNIAIKVNDGIWRDAITTEQAVGQFSNQSIPGFTGAINDTDGDVTAQLLTEGAIREQLIELINQAKAGDSIDLTMFYLAERSAVKSLIAASQRGVTIRLVLDANRDAFGHVKNGVPNRPVAHELQQQGNDIQIRWCDTHGEQCHSKLVLFKISNTYTMLGGSANLTRRNINDYNLETNVLVSAEQQIPAIADAYTYFEDIWSNRDGRIFTTDYSTFAESTFYKTVMYRIQEATGLSSF